MEMRPEGQDGFSVLGWLVQQEAERRQVQRVVEPEPEFVDGQGFAHWGSPDSLRESGSCGSFLCCQP